jgi:tRNA-modifying protein YgfZ
MSIEYRTIADNAGYADRAEYGRLRFEGPDSIAFLQALVTNDVAALKSGQGAYAAYLTPQGRMIADLEVYHRGASVLCGVAPGLAEPLAARFDQLIFSEDVRVRNVSSEISEVSIVGGRAADVAARTFGLERAALEGLGELAQTDVPGGFVVRSGDAPLPSYRVWLDRVERDAVVARLREAGLEPIGHPLLESLRIANARAAWEPDLGTSIIPLEAGLLDRAISTSKGCYVGQEVIIRILHRGGGRVAKRLVQLISEASSTLPEKGAALTNESGAEIGTITSAGSALEGDGWIALGYLSRDAAEVGNVVVVSGTGARARVSTLAR